MKWTAVGDKNERKESLHFWKGGMLSTPLIFYLTHFYLNGGRPRIYIVSKDALAFILKVFSTIHHFGFFLFSFIWRYVSWKWRKWKIMLFVVEWYLYFVGLCGDWLDIGSNGTFYWPACLLVHVDFHGWVIFMLLRDVFQHYDKIFFNLLLFFPGKLQPSRILMN